MAAKYKDYYKILGVDRSATDKEIKSAYRKLAREYHPDLHTGSSKKEAEEKFKEINEAYEVLSDKEKRTKYDTLGANWQHGQDWQPQPGTDGVHYYTWSDNDSGAFSSTGFSDFFEALFGGGIRFDQSGSGFADTIHQSRSMRGHNLESELELSLEEAFYGGEKMVQLASRDVRLSVKIPAGIQDGSKIRLKGQGGEGFNSSNRGDLILKIKLKQHPLYTLKGDDLEAQVRISPEQAVLGSKISVPTLDGEVLLTVPPMTHSGQIFRLRGKGWPQKSGARGDEYIKIIIDIPNKLSQEVTDLYQKLAQAKSKEH